MSPTTANQRLARLGWVVAVLSAVILVIVGTPQRYAQLVTPAPEAASLLGQLLPDEAARLTQSGVSLSTFALYNIVVELLTVAIALGVAGLIFWGRSHEWMALYVSLVLAAIATNLPVVTGIQSAPPLLAALILAWRMVFIGGLMLLFFLFPNGRFVPRWTRWLVWPSLLYTLVWPFVPSIQPPLGFGRGLMVNAPLQLWQFFLFGMGVVAQIWRYARHSTVVERQRTKWVVFGFSLLLVGNVAGIGLLTYVPFAPPGPGYAFARLAGPSLILLGLQAMALSIGFSVLRYRLWDIDILIRRTLVYALLSGLLALLYFSVVVLLQALLRTLTGQAQGQVVTVVSTLAIAALFGPLRARVQAFIDRRFYRHKYNAARTLAGFGAALRDETDLARLSGRLCGVVHETMEPASVGLWLRPGQGAKDARP